MSWRSVERSRRAQWAPVVVAGLALIASPAMPQPSAAPTASSAPVVLDPHLFPSTAPPSRASAAGPGAPQQPSPPGPSGAPAGSASPATSAGPPPGYYGQPPPGYYGQPPPGYYGQPPPGYYGSPPPGYYGGPPADDEPPETLPYEEGRPIPPGYAHETTMLTGLVIAGSVTSGVLWLLSGLAGTMITEVCLAPSGCHDSEREKPQGLYPMWIPLAGPFVTIGTADYESGAVTGLLVLDGVLQCAGVAMLIAGAAVERDVLVWQGGSARLRVGPAAGALTIDLDGPL